jgi:signal transduction histidine kinase
MNKNRLSQPVSVNDLLLVGRAALPAAPPSSHRVRLVANLVADDVDPTVLGDPQLLQVMVENLVRNAIRHSPAGAPVAIEASRAGDEVRIAVRDEGPGIPEEYRDRISSIAACACPARTARTARRTRMRGAEQGSGSRSRATSRSSTRAASASSPNRDRGCAFLVDLPLMRRDEDAEEDAE